MEKITGSKMKSAVILLLVLLLGTICGAASADVVFKSDKPVFAKVSVTADDSKVMSLAFDVSNGFLYDVMYADLNLNGAFEPSEKFTGKAVRLDTGGYSVRFSAAKYRTAFNSLNIVSADKPNELIVRYTVVVSGSKRSYQFMCFLSLKLEDGSDIFFNGTIKPVGALSKARVVGFRGKNKLVVTSKTDGSETRVAISMYIGQWVLVGKTVKTAVVISRKNGEEAYKSSGYMKMLSDGNYGYSAELQSGIYVVDAAVDTGPIAGVVKGRKTISVRQAL